MSVTTDALDAIRIKIEAIDNEAEPENKIDDLVWAVEQLTALVEKLHARILFLEQQQQRQENY